ncbi:hypothetical protein O181_046622, partial [Austropuccinia psidii MF-1]|nr:hypothetical protein [Austropuccinia psidii MF-1]
MRHLAGMSSDAVPNSQIVCFLLFQLERLYFVSILNLSNSSCRALYAPSGVLPAFIPQQRPTLVMLADKHTRNVCLFSAPSDHAAREALAQDTLASTPLWSTMMKPYPSANEHRDPKQAYGNNSGRLARSPQLLIFPPPLRLPSNGHFTPRPERSDYLADEGWQWQEDIRAWANFHHVLSPMGFKRQSKRKPPKSPRQHSPVPSLCRKQTPRQPTPGLSGTRWSEELFREPSGTKEPPIPGPSPSSQPPEDDTT